jgi:crotonobetainyl-CoA:carnitine CoA-transferase CaiB-like acyl-CoA transferase
MATPQVLDGMRVIDVTTGPVGGMATMVLADFGADVVKVEAPGGDRFRSLPDRPLWLRGKRSVTADLATEGGRARVHDLVATADVRGGVGSAVACPALGSSTPTQPSPCAPIVVHCSITGWGPTGPLAELPGWDGAVAARSGRMKAFERQLRRGGPVFAAVPVASHVAAHGAVQGIVAALFARSRHGGPQRVEPACCRRCCRSTSWSCCSWRWPNGASWRCPTSSPPAGICRR